MIIPIKYYNFLCLLFFISMLVIIITLPSKVHYYPIITDFNAVKKISYNIPLYYSGFPDDDYFNQRYFIQENTNMFNDTQIITLTTLYENKSILTNFILFNMNFKIIIPTKFVVFLEITYNTIENDQHIIITTDLLLPIYNSYKIDNILYFKNIIIPVQSNVKIILVSMYIINPINEPPLKNCISDVNITDCSLEIYYLKKYNQ